ncbi:MAG: GDP-L-fucose synthase [Bacteroidia bacterium]|jgi:GDP-L-fucose synthase|uniref:GDP-L-fucose synthase family protein n=1 Tax=Candidatus Pollutiaquabacter sp. TaxID=3416354 RepID=UPI001A445581|nr:GDP-L-fucose synthase [Bacteroidota bacterium]MBL7948394.1 GDP-L-fucose synthase [Bacteroidia bacterium]MBP6010123.1 GDP-L-fucose synthase [Bacteroidia bacterium]MBP7269300.1 GDP-L-fucose synthase [Bacteroidia bacterium]MBP7436871.1 GDP-L-fucose synthase [Bacteroidia bacterium]
MNKHDRIYIAGHNGMVGSAIVRALEASGYRNLLYRSSSELDLRDQAATKTFFEQERPDYVFLAAAKVGGIHANNIYRAEFLYDNLMIEANVIDAAWKFGVKKLLFLGSSCIYPKNSPQPLKEEYLLSGYLEQTNEPYAIAKIAGIKLCESYRKQYGANFIAAMPTNLYGPNDNYDLQQSHVLPALIRKFHEAKMQQAASVEIWGTGTPLREFLHVDDLAAACLQLMDHYDEAGFLNVGSGEEVSIRDLAELIRDITGFTGELRFDPSRPDGTARKLMDSSKIRSLGWSPKISLKNGISAVYKDYQAAFTPA